HELGRGTAPPDVGDRLVLIRLVPALRRLEAVPLDQDESVRLPLSLEHLDRPAAGEIAAPVALDHRGGLRCVLREALCVLDGHVSDQVGGHGYSSRSTSWRRPHRSKLSAPSWSCARLSFSSFARARAASSTSESRSCSTTT